MINTILEFPIYKPIIMELVLTTGWIFFIVIIILITLFILYSDKQELEKNLAVTNDKLKQKEAVLSRV